MRISDWSSDVCSSDLGIQILDSQGTCVLSLALTRYITEVTLAGTGYVDCRLQCMPLVAGQYLVKVRVSSQTLLDEIPSAAGMRIETSSLILTDSAGLGLFYQMADWRFRSEAHTSELQSLMRISYAAFCLQKKSANFLCDSSEETTYNIQSI